MSVPFSEKGRFADAMAAGGSDNRAYPDAQAARRAANAVLLPRGGCRRDANTACRAANGTGSHEIADFRLLPAAGYAKVAHLTSRLRLHALFLARRTAKRLRRRRNARNRAEGRSASDWA